MKIFGSQPAEATLAYDDDANQLVMLNKDGNSTFVSASGEDNGHTIFEGWVKKAEAEKKIRKKSETSKATTETVEE